jgi:hypothetical protein
VLPLTYENTKFSSINKKVKQMMADRDEALAAHELARTRMAERSSPHLLLDRRSG